MKQTLSYYANVLIGLPLFFLLSLTANTYRMLRQAVSFTVLETKETYRSNRRAHNR